MSQRKFTWQQLAECNTATNACVAVRGRVYDVTGFLSAHPGGWDMLYLNAGKDATALFEAYHPQHVVDKGPLAFSQIKEVGVLVSTEYPSFPPMSDFYKTAKQRVADYFKSQNMRKTHAVQMLLRAVVWTTLSFALWYLGAAAVAHGYGSFVPLSCAAVVGFLMAMISLMPVHEASHGASTSSPWVWRLTGALHDWMNGASFFSWIHQHLLGHHPFTHIEELDPDIVTGDPDARRIKKTQPILSLYRFQHIYMPLLYGGLAVKFRVNDLSMLFSSRKNGEIRMNDPGAWHWFNFVAGKIFFVVWRFLLPGYFVGYWKMFTMCFVADLVCSYYLALVFQPSHVVGQAHMLNLKTGKNADDKHIDMDWAEMQVRTTIDYGHGSALTTFLTGGLNYQVAHHLFPGICQMHYPAITPIIMQTCKEYGIDYVTVPTYWDALMCHFKYLYDMGREAKKAHFH